MNFKQRINRIVGQLKGIDRMVETKRDCNDILQQLSAIKKAIDGLSKEIVMSDFCDFVPKDKEKKMKEMVERVINL